MTLDEAIIHCEEVAEEQEKLCRVNDKFNFSQPKWRKCGKEHRQLAEWLKELKRFREQQPCYNPDEWCTDCKEYNKDKHCCPRYNSVIRKTIEEMKQSETAYWIPTKDKCWWECSNCGQVIYSQTDRLEFHRFCGRCGRRMIEREQKSGD